MLHRAGIGCRVFEAAPGIRPLGVGINVLPHAVPPSSTSWGSSSRSRLSASRRANAAFYNRFGQLIYVEPAGTPRRLRLAAVLDPSRRPAGRARPRGTRAAAPADANSSPSGAACASSTGRGARHGALRRCNRHRLSRRSRVPSPSAATACIRCSAGSSIRTKASRATRGSTCGAASRAGRRSFRARRWSARVGSSRRRWSSIPFVMQSRRPGASVGQLGRRDRDAAASVARDWNQARPAGGFPAGHGRLEFRLARCSGDYRARMRFWNFRWSIMIRCRAGLRSRDAAG